MALDKNGIAKRIAQELENNTYVNLGIGIPTLVANHIPKNINVEFQSENGVLGMGPFPLEGEEDPDMINAGKQTITTMPGAVLFDSATSFSMIRGNHIQLSVLGAMEVAENGKLFSRGRFFLFRSRGAWRHEHLAGVLCRPCDRGCAAYAPWLSCSMPGALFAHRRCVGGTNLARTCEVLEKEPRPPTCAAPTGGVMHRPEHCTRTIHILTPAN